MQNTFRIFVSIAILLGFVFFLNGCQGPSTNNTKSEDNMKAELEKPKWTPEQEELKSIVEKFLIVAGNYDLEAMDEMISNKANLGISRYREGAWISTTITIDEYFENAKTRELLPYFEPVGEYIIHMNEGQLAFVWADAVLHRFGVPRTRNIDNFTLIKENGDWKFLNLSFTVNPLPEDQKKFDLEIFAKSYAQAWSGKRANFVAMYFDEDGSLRVNDGEPANGRNEITEVAQGFMTDLPDMHVSFDSLVSKSNGTEFHWTLKATNSGPGGTGNKVNVSGYELWQIENGLIKKSQGSFPTEEYNRQLQGSESK